MTRTNPLPLSRVVFVAPVSGRSAAAQIGGISSAVAGWSAALQNPTWQILIFDLSRQQKYYGFIFADPLVRYCGGLHRPRPPLLRSPGPGASAFRPAPGTECGVHGPPTETRRDPPPTRINHRSTSKASVSSR